MRFVSGGARRLGGHRFRRADIGGTGAAMLAAGRIGGLGGLRRALAGWGAADDESEEGARGRTPFAQVVGVGADRAEGVDGIREGAVGTDEGGLAPAVVALGRVLREGLGLEEVEKVGQRAAELRGDRGGAHGRQRLVDPGAGDGKRGSEARGNGA